jgi:hypothetical protein
MRASANAVELLYDAAVCGYCSNLIMPCALDAARSVQRQFGSGCVLEEGRVACAVCRTAIAEGLLRICAECGAPLNHDKRVFCDNDCSAKFCTDG